MIKVVTFSGFRPFPGFEAGSAKPRLFLRYFSGRILEIIVKKGDFPSFLTFSWLHPIEGAIGIIKAASKSRMRIIPLTFN